MKSEQGSWSQNPEQKSETKKNKTHHVDDPAPGKVDGTSPEEKTARSHRLGGAEPTIAGPKPVRHDWVHDPCEKGAVDQVRHELRALRDGSRRDPCTYTHSKTQKTYELQH